MVWIDKSIVKIADLEYELKNLRLSHAIQEEHHQDELAGMHRLVVEATDAAMRSARSASVAVVAARHVLRLGKQGISQYAEAAAEAAVLATEAAREASRSVVMVLENASMAMTQRVDPGAIQRSVAATAAVIRSAEAAAEISSLARKATLALNSHVSRACVQSVVPKQHMRRRQSR